MSEALVIRLVAASQDTAATPSSTPDATPQAEWLAVDTTGARHGNVQSGPLSSVAEFAGGRKIILLVPGTDVYLAEPVLPLKSGAKLAQVVPFALEEHMAADIESLHF